MYLNNWRICDNHVVDIKWGFVPDEHGDYPTLRSFDTESIEKLVKEFWEIGWGTEFDFDSVFEKFLDLFEKSENPEKNKGVKFPISRDFYGLAELIEGDWWDSEKVKRPIGIYCSTWGTIEGIENTYIFEDGKYKLIPRVCNFEKEVN